MKWLLHFTLLPGCSFGYCVDPTVQSFSCSNSFALDINECLLNSSVCDQICLNTAGSYSCSCEPGYQLVNGTNICHGENFYNFYLFLHFLPFYIIFLQTSMSVRDQMVASSNVTTQRVHTTVAVWRVLLSTVMAGAAKVLYFIH